MANNLDQVNSGNSDNNGNGNNNSIPRVCVTYCHFPQDSLELINQVWPNYLNFVFALIAFKFGPGSSVKLLTGHAWNSCLRMMEILCATLKVIILKYLLLTQFHLLSMVIKIRLKIFHPSNLRIDFNV